MERVGKQQPGRFNIRVVSQRGLLRLMCLYIIGQVLSQVELELAEGLLDKLFELGRQLLGL